MLKTRLLMAAVLAALIAGPAFAAETPVSAPSTPTVVPTVVAQVDLPAEITGVPAPTYRYGMKQGPCNVAVTCIGNYTISCAGQTVCYWKLDNPNPSLRGFVECDGYRTWCTFGEN
ncbi:MAG: hypothetical protein ABUT39_28280 [Acidobacteriota bacterium]